MNFASHRNISHLQASHETLSPTKIVKPIGVVNRLYRRMQRYTAIINSNPQRTKSLLKRMDDIAKKLESANYKRQKSRFLNGC